MLKYLVQAVLFDLDGVVVYTDKYHFLAWQRLAKENKWQFDEELNNKLRGIPRASSLQIILDHNGITLTQEDKETLAETKNIYYKESLKKISKDDICPGALEFINQLRATNIKTALCSSSRNTQIVLNKLQITNLFDVIITGNDIKNAKPNPEIFTLAADKLEIHPFHCLVFEDAVSGIEAARAAGMKYVGIGSSNELKKVSDAIINFDEIEIDYLLETGKIFKPIAEPWTLAETHPDIKKAKYWESMFALSNGYIGLRGTYEQNDDYLSCLEHPGMYINGIYDYEPINYTISYPGFPQQRHLMLNLCDWRIINLDIDGERFNIFEGKLLEYRRELNFKYGVVTSSIVWESPALKRIKVKITRLVSMTRLHNAVIRYEVEPITDIKYITFNSIVNHNVKNISKHLDARLSSHKTNECVHTFLYKTDKSDFTIGMSLGHSINLSSENYLNKEISNENKFISEFKVNSKMGQRIVFDKHVCFYTSRETSLGNISEETSNNVISAIDDGFEVLYEEHVSFWEQHWNIADIEIEGNIADQQALRYSLFHLCQSCPTDSYTSISACGLTGDNYRGHVYWDTEMYMVPHFVYTFPKLVKPLLMYRYNTLEKAKQRAHQMGGVGALYAWSSISGEECETIYEASTAQYHLLSDIAYAIGKYWEATGDKEFLVNYGAEIIFETARFLADRGSFIPARGNKFCINSVCGPNEYSCGVNNNCYTNMMVQWHMQTAVAIYDYMSKSATEQFLSLTKRTLLKDEERQLWQRIADNMYIPFNEPMGIHEADDSFLYLDPVKMKKMPQHMDVRFIGIHPINLWRMQIIKQADVVLLMFVLGQKFTTDQKRANYAYYEPLTNHGSSLSTSIHSIIASEIGKFEEAYEYWRQSAYMDINNIKDNAEKGLHMACMGGTWMAIVNGFAGMRDYPNGLEFNPIVPDRWKAYRFKINYKGSLILVDINRNGTNYKLLSGKDVCFYSAGNKIELSLKCVENSTI